MVFKPLQILVKVTPELTAYIPSSELFVFWNRTDLPLCYNKLFGILLVLPGSASGRYSEHLQVQPTTYYNYTAHESQSRGTATLSWSRSRNVGGAGGRFGGPLALKSKT